MTTEYAREDINTADIVEGTAVDMQQPVDTKTADETGASKSIADKDPGVISFPHDAAVVTKDAPVVALISREESDHLRTRWLEVQGKFVDEPRSAVQEADVLVSEVIEQLTQLFANEHTLLEGQWKQGKEVSTEDLRQALLRYHSFFKRLVV